MKSEEDKKISKAKDQGFDYKEKGWLLAVKDCCHQLLAAHIYRHALLLERAGSHSSM